VKPRKLLPNSPGQRPWLRGAVRGAQPKTSPASQGTPLQLVSPARRLYIGLRSFGNLGGLPSVLIVGAQKAGTSSLFRWLSRHPQVAKPLIKEVHYFDYQSKKNKDWYAANFDGRPERIRIDASPYYLFHPKVPERAANLLPHCKIICLLRDSVDRAFSHYQMNLRLGIEHLEFYDAVKAEPKRLGASAEMLEKEAIDYHFGHQNFSYVSRGLYGCQIKNWLRFFPVERFHFISFDDLIYQPLSVLEGVEQFLGLSSFNFDDLCPRNQGKGVSLPVDARTGLAPLFEESNRQVLEITGLSIQRAS